MSPTSRFPRPTTSDITKIGIELPAEASEALDRELEFEQVESREARTCLLYTSLSGLYSSASWRWCCSSW